jgi:hypothetical protein
LSYMIVKNVLLIGECGKNCKSQRFFAFFVFLTYCTGLYSDNGCIQ